MRNEICAMELLRLQRRILGWRWPPPFVVETSPVFAPQNLCIPSSTTRFHSPLPALSSFEQSYLIAPLLPFLFQLRTLSSPTFYQQFVSTINLPFRHFLSLSSSRPLCLSSILPASYPLFFSSHLFHSLTSIFSFVSPSCQGCFFPFSSLSPFIL